MMRARATYEREGSPSSRKKQRLSSPTYDDQLELSQNQLRAFDDFDREFSRRPTPSPKSPPKPSQAISTDARRKRSMIIAEALKENVSKDTEDAVSPVRAENATEDPQVYAGLKSASALPMNSEVRPRKHTGFAPALALTPDDIITKDDLPSSSPDAPPEKDMSAWFESDDRSKGPAGFTSAKSLAEADGDNWFTAPAPAGASGFKSAKSIHLPADTEALPYDDDSFDAPKGMEEIPAVVGFITGSNLLNPGKAKTSNLMPSVEALAKAAETMKRWQKEMEDDFPGGADVEHDQEYEDMSAHVLPTLQPAFRSVLGDVENSFTDRQLPSTPTPIGAGFRSLSPLTHRTARDPDKKNTFKSPLLSTSARAKAPTSYVASPLNPDRPNNRTTFATPSHRSPPTTPARPIATSPPKKTLGVTPRRNIAGTSLKKPAFTTPFRAGMRPGEPGRHKLDVAHCTGQQEPSSSSVEILGGSIRTPSSVKAKGKARATFFDLTKPDNRKTLHTCGLIPQSCSEDELQNMGINVAELTQITPETAVYYSFHSSACIPAYVERSAPSPTASLLGVSAALDELRNAGCALATKSWVENCWGLILWKLAGMVCLDPKREADPENKRWCWNEVIRQLRYRYERELNSGSRPPLRLIAAQDTPASLPMVLCASNITWTPGGIDEDGISLEPVPELEVTDGWYRMRTEIDQPIIRAIQKGRIAVGKKIAITGARLSGDRKDATEILEGASSVALKIHGNSSHLAAWHAKLGFQREPFIATLGSLTSDGGPVAILDLVIVKAYPIAYIEFVETDSGDKKREGPRNEKEEAVAHDKWLAKREAVAAKIRNATTDKLHTLEGYAERLERKAGSGFRPSVDDSPPDVIDDLLLGLEEGSDANSIIRRTTAQEAGWLARAIRDKCQRDRDASGEDISRELDSECPPREVRNFRVIVVRDARTQKRPAERCAQVTVWDVLSAYVSEDGKAGQFKEGQRFMVSNLIPTQQTAWMPRGEDSVIYLSTRKDSRWQKRKA